METITVAKGSTQVITSTITKNSVAFDITWMTVKLHVKDEIDSSALTLDVTWSVTNWPNGVAQFTLSSSDTNIETKQYFYEIRVVDWTDKYLIEDSSNNTLGNFIVKDTLNVPS